MAVNNVDERNGIIPCNTEWGKWWQTLTDICIEIILPVSTQPKDIDIEIKKSSITCNILGKTLFSGKLFKDVCVQACTWTLENNGTLINMELTKFDDSIHENAWESLMEDGSFKADPVTYIEMTKKMDLEKLQTKYPGMDFST